MLTRPSHILLISPTFSCMTGADRDWVTLANSLDPKLIRVTWSGSIGTGFLRPYLSDKIVTELIDAHLPYFTYLIQMEAYRLRSSWLWGKIITDHLIRLRQPFNILRRYLQTDPVDLIVSNTAAVTIGSVIAALWRVPHVWCIKECLDTNIAAVRHFARLVPHLSSAVVVPSNAVGKAFSSKVHVIPDGTNVLKIQRSGRQRSRAEIIQRLSLPLDQPVVVQVGGIVQWKGQQISAEAIVKLAEAKSVPYFSFVFLGKGDDTYRKEVEKILAQLPHRWRERIRFSEFDPDDFSYLNAADIVVHPSILPDPFPNAVREAMILGKPVIGACSGGIPEMIKDGETGMLVEPRNSEALAKALNLLLSSVDMRSKLGRAAQEFAIRYFDITYRQQDFLKLFIELLAPKRRLIGN